MTVPANPCPRANRDGHGPGPGPDREYVDFLPSPAILSMRQRNDEPGETNPCAALTSNRYKYFRWTKRTAVISFAYIIAVPAIVGYLGYTSDVSSLLAAGNVASGTGLRSGWDRVLTVC